jgi:glycosyltransferase involved in cell wall biosynthesis
VTFGRAVTVIRQANEGSGSARNAGVAAATGEIIHFMDSDDLISLNSYSEKGAKIEEGSDVAYGPWLKAIFENGKVKGEPLVLQQRPVPIRYDLQSLVLRTVWMPVLQSTLMRSSLVNSAGPFRTDLRTGEDLEFFARALARLPIMVHDTQSLLVYRLHPGQITGPNSESIGVERVQLLEVLQLHADAADLSPWQRYLFRLRRLQREREAGVSKHTSSLFLRASSVGAEAWSQCVPRLKVRLGASPYGPHFQAGPIDQMQGELIQQLNALTASASTGTKLKSSDAETNACP